MQSEVRGKAIIKPTKPNNTPHIERDSNIMAGLRPTALPIMLGTSIISCIT